MIRTMDTAIYTEADYDAALVEIERLFNCAPGTADAERLNFLVDQVEAYEAEHYPIGQPSAEAVAEYEAQKQGQNFEQAKAATFAQYGDAFQRLADVQRDGLLDAGATEMQAEKASKN